MSSWSDLSIKDRADIMKVAVRNGITKLSDIRDEYNAFAEGGKIPPTEYEKWKQAIAAHKGLNMNDPSYDYESYYRDNPEIAWSMLTNNPNAHFPDDYKTVYHPTFSTLSKYSGVKDPIYNPEGLVGGTWNGNVFTMSEDGYRGPVSMDERIQYLEAAEDNGAQLREADGSLPYLDDGTFWQGVLPAVNVVGKHKAEGGNLYDGGGYIYDVLPQLLRNAGLDIRVTSGYRDPNRHVGKNWKTSLHGKHGAVDIVPQGKTTYDDIRRVIYSDPTIINYMVSNGFGLLDETDPETMRKTGATGKHFHFGRDSKPAARYAATVGSKVSTPSNRVIGNPVWTQNAERMWAQAQPMYKELIDAGVNPVEAAGILGNIALESGFNPNASNSINGGHWGYLQNDKNITPWVRANYGGYDHRNQMNYLIAGLQGRLPKANMGLSDRFNGYRAAMRGVTDPQQAAYLWERHYEKSANEAIPQRKYYAQYFYDKMMGSNPKAASYVPEIPEGYVFPDEVNPFAGFRPSNPELFFNGYKRPDVEVDPVQPLVADAKEYSEAELKRQERQKGIENFFMLQNLLSSGTTSDSNDLMGALKLFTAT